VCVCVCVCVCDLWFLCTVEVHSHAYIPQVCVRVCDYCRWQCPMCYGAAAVAVGVAAFVAFKLLRH